MTDGLKNTKTLGTYARAWRWRNAEPLANKSLVKVLYKKENLCFGPYSYTPQMMFTPLTLGEANEEVMLI